MPSGIFFYGKDKDSSIAAASTDYFIQATPTFSTVIGSGGVANGTATTIPLDSVSGLSTTTAVELVINRLDSNNAVTNNYETVRGVISGSNLTSVVRGVEGTAQGWAAGIKVEYLQTADIQNRMVTGVLVAHNQDGTHKSGQVLTLPQINDTSSDHQYVFAVSELTADRTVTLPLLTGTDTFTFNAATETLTNKRVTKRTGTTTSSATPTINTDNVDFYSITAQTEAITSFTTNLSGTPTEAQTLWIAITGTAARGITWGTSFEASTIALPTTTVTTARLDVGFVWNTVTSKWRCIASG